MFREGSTLLLLLLQAAVTVATPRTSLPLLHRTSPEQYPQPTIDEQPQQQQQQTYKFFEHLSSSSTSTAAVAVVYSSQFNHTLALAQAIADGALGQGADVRLLNLQEVDFERDIVTWADALVMGCPVHYGNAQYQVSQPVKPLQFLSKANCYSVRLSLLLSACYSRTPANARHVADAAVD